MIYGIIKMGTILRLNWIIEMVAFFCEPNFIFYKIKGEHSLVRIYIKSAKKVTKK